MKYRNKETGRIIEVNCQMGGLWEPVSQPKPAAEKPEAPKKAEPKSAPKKGKK